MTAFRNVLFMALCIANYGIAMEKNHYLFFNRKDCDYGQLALQAYKAGRIREHEQYLLLIPENQKAPAYHQLALEYCKPHNGDLSRKKTNILMAKEFFKESIKKNFIESNYYLGKLYYKENQLAEAAPYLHTYANLCKKNENNNEKTKKHIGKAFNLLGAIYQSLVIKCYETASSYGDTDSLLALGKLCEGECKLEDALDYYQKAEKAYKVQLVTAKEKKRSYTKTTYAMKKASAKTL